MKRILWITNIVFPEANKALNVEADFKGSGGWLLASAQAIIKDDNIQLIVASISDKVRQLKCIKGKKIVYYLLPVGRGGKKYNKEYEVSWKEIKEKEKPDIIHIHGTELSYGLSYLKACGNKSVVVSIQGLASVIYRYYYAGLSNFEILKNITFRDLFGRSIWHEKKQFKLRGKIEIETLRQCQYIIGRTRFDKTHAKIINPEARYFTCNETLREVFYSGKWDYSKCKKHTIFLSQGWYPLKGVHQVLKAFPIILRSFPDARIRIAGPNITKTDTISKRMRQSGYAKYLSSLIRCNQLEDKVYFTGSLSAEEVKQELLNCNVFICPSSIENSSNSLAEAQLLGVPCVVSYVGGLPDMMKEDEYHLYRFEEVEMMASLTMEIFHGQSLNDKQQIISRQRHDPDINLNKLLEIYKIIINETNESI